MTTKEKIDLGKLVSLVAGFIAIVSFGWKVVSVGYSIKENQDMMKKDITEVKQTQVTHGQSIKEIKTDVQENKNDTKSCHFEIEVLCEKLHPLIQDRSCK